jgi:hypothetical protein
MASASQPTDDSDDLDKVLDRIPASFDRFQEAHF